MVDYLSPPTKQDLRHRGRVSTLGMFIIDQFEIKDDYGNAVITEDEEIGGGGIWAMTAARHFLPPSHVGMLVDRGTDFPQRFTDVLEGMGREMVWFRRRDAKTSRALNMYSGKAIGEGHQIFKYTSPQLNLLPHDLLLPPSPFTTPNLPEWIHVVCSTTRARLMVDEMVTIRRDGVGALGIDTAAGGELGKGWEGKMVWEPLPLSTIPSELENFKSLAPHFAIISPNLLELQTLLSITPSDQPTQEEVEHATRIFHSHLSSQSSSQSQSPTHIPALIIRAGALGSYTLSPEFTGWIPAFWTSENKDQVVDPTGGGNAFLGGLLAGLLISKGDLRVASIYASTAASFAIQQRGLPVLTTDGKGRERWNDDSPWERLREMASRVS